jgi:hypothetical protein
VVDTYEDQENKDICVVADTKTRRDHMTAVSNKITTTSHRTIRRKRGMAVLQNMVENSVAGNRGIVQRHEPFPKAMKAAKKPGFQWMEDKDIPIDKIIVIPGHKIRPIQGYVETYAKSDTSSFGSVRPTYKPPSQFPPTPPSTANSEDEDTFKHLMERYNQFPALEARCGRELTMEEKLHFLWFDGDYTTPVSSIENDTATSISSATSLDTASTAQTSHHGSVFIMDTSKEYPDRLQNSWMSKYETLFWEEDNYDQHCNKEYGYVLGRSRNMDELIGYWLMCIPEHKWFPSGTSIPY